MQIWALRTCNQDISTIIIASSFKHGQLTEMISILLDENKKKSCNMFLSCCPLQILALETSYQDISTIVITSSFKHGQLVEVHLGIGNFKKNTCISKHFIASNFKLCQLITGCIFFILVQIRTADRG